MSDCDVCSNKCEHQLCKRRKRSICFVCLEAMNSMQSTPRSEWRDMIFGLYCRKSIIKAVCCDFQPIDMGIVSLHSLSNFSKLVYFYTQLDYDDECVYGLCCRSNFVDGDILSFVETYFINHFGERPLLACIFWLADMIVERNFSCLGNRNTRNTTIWQDFYFATKA